MKTYTVREGGAHHRRLWYVIILLLVLAGYSFWALARPLPLLTPTEASQVEVRAPAGQLQWPPAGQAAVGIVGSSMLQTHGTQRPTPTASTAKLITALVVLEKKPLQAGQQGPTLTLNANDVKLYSENIAQDGSLVKVQAGEKISQYQVLQTIMLPSANNMADSLAIWAFGSLKNYSQVANAYLQRHGLNDTKVGSDASGLGPSTTSTAADLVKIGKLAMQNPVLAEIVAQPSATGIPVVNNIKNVNQLLGTSNIIGIKTGNTDQAGGVFVSASRVAVNGKPVTIVTAVANSPTLFQAMKDSLPLVQSAQANFKPVTVVSGGSTIAAYKVPWGQDVSVIATRDLALDAWGGSSVRANTQLKKIPVDSRAGQTVGSVTVPNSAVNNPIRVPAKLQATPPPPSTWWRLTHPL